MRAHHTMNFELEVTVNIFGSQRLALVKRRKLSEHTDSSCPRNADPQGERGDGGPL